MAQEVALYITINTNKRIKPMYMHSFEGIPLFCLVKLFGLTLILSLDVICVVYTIHHMYSSMIMWQGKLVWCSPVITSHSQQKS